MLSFVNNIQLFLCTEKSDKFSYSPDLAPSDFHLFRSMQHALEDTHFANLDELQKWIDNWIASKNKSFFS